MKALSKTVGVLALSRGESELAAVVRAATEGFGLHSILSSMWRVNLTRLQQSGWSIGPDWEESDIWLLETCGCNTMLVQGKFEFPKCQDCRIRATHKPRVLGRNQFCHTKTCDWAPVGVDPSTGKPATLSGPELDQQNVEVLQENRDA